MGSLSGLFQRPVVAASAVALASVSTDLRDRFFPSKPDSCPSSEQSIGCSSDLISEAKWAQISNSGVSKLSFSTKSRIPVPNFRYPTTHIPNKMASDVAFSSALLNVYRSAELAKAHRPIDHAHSIPTNTSNDLIYRWHLPQPNAIGLSENSKMVVVLLGWLGAKQKHLKKYADWYTSKGFHVITFTFPMSEILSYKVGGKTEEHVNSLVNHLSEWLEEEYGKNLVFHTFSNTGWLIYGAILEKFQMQDLTLMGRIKGCIVDSAPVASPDPQVWASGFSAAFLKKNSIAAKGHRNEGDISAKPAMSESALLVVLEKFFGVVLNLPSVNQRLSNVLVQLKSGQPSCPQLYIYSSADKVIPAGSVESFIEAQQRTGRVVRSCNFKSTPHVDHFRNEPELYASQLSQFLKDCVHTS
ncbi:uncharacterized protein LOC111884403 [Lactuca sativa]|uniref:Uncharacterized protein n=1 Tax=Lactuca sativa TaxID=4236 RepID=A0A9R1W754_LACSA|nr:uncharacterized protein LOC111884403 [Lactuca sativa]KAJ0218653.1 hypothetical protein LSAT_V11C300115530 [Lactuca sativa]